MHIVPNLSKQDISTLQRIGHFYFALTSELGNKQPKAVPLLLPGAIDLEAREIAAGQKLLR
jgi:hypothetical protein